MWEWSPPSPLSPGITLINIEEQTWQGFKQKVNSVMRDYHRGSELDRGSGGLSEKRQLSSDMKNK